MSKTFVVERRECAREFSLLSALWEHLAAERLKELGLTESRWCTLYWLSRQPEGMSQTALAERAGVEAPTLVRTLDGLEQQGLLRREPSKRDRRVNLVQLTEAGAALAIEVKRHRDDLREAAMGGMSVEDHRTLVRLLQQMREGLRHLATPVVAAAA